MWKWKLCGWQSFQMDIPAYLEWCVSFVMCQFWSLRPICALTASRMPLRSANLPEAVKSNRLDDAQKHLALAKLQRHHYNDQCKLAKLSLERETSLTVAPEYMHYSFDFRCIFCIVLSNLGNFSSAHPENVVCLECVVRQYLLKLTTWLTNPTWLVKELIPSLV